MSNPVAFHLRSAHCEGRALRRAIHAFTLAVLIFPGVSSRAENIVFPLDSRVIDVRQAPYNAKGDGRTDDTAALQKALTENWAREAIIYLPNGTYLISDTLKWGDGPHAGFLMKNTMLQGQSESGTIIKLKDACATFTDPAKPRPMVLTGVPPAQRFRSSLRNLTLDVGAGNPGANGALFYVNNQGTIRNLTVCAPEGSGNVGLDFNLDENGPLLARDVTITGFDTAAFYAHGVNSITMERVNLSGQRRRGIANEGNIISIRGLKSTNSVPVVINTKGSGVVTVVDGKLTGTGAAKEGPAIINDGPNAGMFLRNLKTTGYKRAVDQPQGPGPGADGPDIVEFVSHPPMSVFASPLTSLNLPVKETPEIPWDPVEKWVSPMQFGGNPDDDLDDSDAIQKAIDSGATTVYLTRPNVLDEKKGVRKGWMAAKTIIIRGNVRRIIGTEAVINAIPPLSENAAEPIFRFQDGAAPAVILERFFQGYKKQVCPFLIHESKRTLILSSMIIREYRNTGTGDVFFDDVCADQTHIMKQNFYARQLNIENKGEHLVNDGGNVWVLGYKTEKRYPLIVTRQGGQTEILGGHCYSNEEAKEDTMCIVENGKLSVAGFGETAWKYPWGYSTIADIKRGNAQRAVSDRAVVRRGSGSQLPLFVENSTTRGTPPPAPAFQATRHSATIELALPAPGGGVVYRIERDGQIAGYSWGGVFVNASLTPGKSYKYRVAAESLEGAESLSDEQTVDTPPDAQPPTVPSAPKTSGLTPRRVTLSWAASTDDVGVTGYEISRAGAPAVKIEKTTFTDAKLQAGQKYAFEIRAFDATGNRSEPLKIDVSAPAEAPPTERVFAGTCADFYRLNNRGSVIGGMSERSWTKYENVDTGDPGKPYKKVKFRYGGAVAGAVIELRIDVSGIKTEGEGKTLDRKLENGKVVASHVIHDTGGWSKEQEFSEPINLPSGGLRDIYMTFSRGTGKGQSAFADIAWFELSD